MSFREKTNVLDHSEILKIEIFLKTNEKKMKDLKLFQQTLKNDGFFSRIKKHLSFLKTDIFLTNERFFPTNF